MVLGHMVEGQSSGAAGQVLYAIYCDDTETGRIYQVRPLKTVLSFVAIMHVSIMVTARPSGSLFSVHFIY